MTVPAPVGLESTIIRAEQHALPSWRGRRLPSESDRGGSLGGAAGLWADRPQKLSPRPVGVPLRAPQQRAVDTRRTQKKTTFYLGFGAARDWRG